MHAFTKTLLAELEKKGQAQLDPYVNDLIELSSLDDLIKACPHWTSCTGHQYMSRLFHGEVLRPMSVPATSPKYRNYGRLDVYSNGDCIFMITDFDKAKGTVVRIFKWRVCAHECTSTNIGRCYTRYVCSKCGYSYAIDSSD